MDIVTAILIAVILLLLGVIGVACFLAFCKKNNGRPRYRQEEDYVEQKHLEFSKIIMLVILFMWVVGGFVGFWAVIHDTSYLMNILDYIQNPVVAGVGVYGLKSGAENWKKLTPDNSGEYTNEEEQNYE